MLAVSLLVVSCSKKEVLTTSQPEGFAHICVGVNDFTITEGEFPTRDGEPVIEYAGVKAIDLAFYEGTTEVYKHTQMRDDGSTYTTFGSFECDLPIGNYTMVVIVQRRQATHLSVLVKRSAQRRV